MAKKLIGIDFGTSTTLVASRTDRGEPRVLPIGATTPWLPSVAGLSDDGELVVGEDALRLPPNRQLRSVKSRFTAGHDEVEIDGTRFPTRDVVKAVLSEALRRARSIDTDLDRQAQYYFGCPVLWTGRERRMLADVALELGVDVDVADIIDEPVAAGLHAVQNARLTSGQRIDGEIVVFDAGGGTLDVAFVKAEGHNVPDFTVLAAEGVGESGDVLDHAIVGDLSAALPDVAADPTGRILLRLRATQLKEILSVDVERELPLGEPFREVVRYTRTQLEAVFGPQLSRAAALVRSTVRGSELRTSQGPSPTAIRAVDWEVFAGRVRHVVLVGGLSQVPAVRRQMEDQFPGANVMLLDRPQESVALGLAMGDELERLNLPRPPVDFVIEYDRDLLERHGLARWADGLAPLYSAFSPLYTLDELVRGQSLLGSAVDLPYPPHFSGELRGVIRAVAPTRDRSPIRFQLGTSTTDGIQVCVRRRGQGRFKLYTNGDLAITDDRGTLKARIKSWPRLRGVVHDFEREIGLDVTTGSKKPWSQGFDYWRFN